VPEVIFDLRVLFGPLFLELVSHSELHLFVTALHFDEAAHDGGTDVGAYFFQGLGGVGDLVCNGADC
jgi:hypothetical protein